MVLLRCNRGCRGKRSTSSPRFNRAKKCGPSLSGRNNCLLPEQSFVRAFSLERLFHKRVDVGLFAESKQFRKRFRIVYAVNNRLFVRFR
jgi:hypothetical protein